MGEKVATVEIGQTQVEAKASIIADYGLTQLRRITITSGDNVATFRIDADWQTTVDMTLMTIARLVGGRLAWDLYEGDLKL